MGAGFMRLHFLVTAPCSFVPRQSIHNTVPLCSNLIVKFKRWVNVAGTLSSFFYRKCSCCFVAEREVVFSLWSADPDGPVMICESITYLKIYRKLLFGISWCTYPRRSLGTDGVAVLRLILTLWRTEIEGGESPPKGRVEGWGGVWASVG
jgi:hypothetical protein